MGWGAECRGLPCRAKAEEGDGIGGETRLGAAPTPQVDGGGRGRVAAAEEARGTAQSGERTRPRHGGAPDSACPRGEAGFHRRRGTDGAGRFGSRWDSGPPEDRPRLGRRWDRQVEGHAGRDTRGRGPDGCAGDTACSLSVHGWSLTAGPDDQGSTRNAHAQRGGPGSRSAGDSRPVAPAGERERRGRRGPEPRTQCGQLPPKERRVSEGDSCQGQRRRESERTRTGKSPPALPCAGRRPRGGSRRLAARRAKIHDAAAGRCRGGPSAAAPTHGDGKVRFN